VGVKKANRARKFTPPPIQVEGLEVRAAAVNALSLVHHDKLFLEEALNQTASGLSDPRDRAFAHAMAATALRRKGQIEQILAQYVEHKLKARTGKAPFILLCGATQLLFMETEPHAAISTSVALASIDEKAQRLKGLINAVLRNISRDRDQIMAALPPADTNLPKWLHTRLRADYGPEMTMPIAEAHSFEANLDLSLKTPDLPKELEQFGELLPTGTLRLNIPHPAIPELPGFKEGNWWVQDAAAALPVQLLGNISGKTALDMCAAPGGKTMQMCARGAVVTAVDMSASRMTKITENLERTGLKANCVNIDALRFEPLHLFDVILLDAPCSATGTIRRHPDMPYIRGNDEVKLLLAMQRKLLRKAATLLQPSGLLVYAVCSLLADEGPKQVAAFLNEHADFKRDPVDPEHYPIPAQFISRSGDLRTLPHYQIDQFQGMDGFFAARLIKSAN
jgi:16S rRNA (cytosine967-C5)-methyltransferase